MKHDQWNTAVLAHRRAFNDDRTEPFPVAAFNMVMLMYVPGEQYSGPELSATLTDAGFRDIEVKPRLAMGA